jgi:hypothetical protein
MNDIILGGPPIPLYDFDDLTVNATEYDNQIYDIIDLLKSHYKLSDDKVKYAYDAFVKATGFDLTLLANDADIIKEAQLALTNANTLYVSLLISITLVIIIWVFCLVGLYSWIVALILTSIIIFFIVILSFAYRSKCDRIINEETSKLKEQSQQSLENFKNSVPHWPKGLYDALLTIINEPNNINDIKNVIHTDTIHTDIKKDCGCKKR